MSVTIGLTETQLQASIVDACRQMGLYAYHTHDSRRSERGFPDLVVLGPGGALFRELKSAQGKPTREQEIVLSLMAGAGLDAAIWRPGDWTSGAAATQLNAIRRRR